VPPTGRHLKSFARIAALLAACAGSAAASGSLTSVSDYQVKTWSTAQGLPHPSVLALAQTPDGYLWCGTEAGLARFDGVRFTVFDSQNAPELGTGWIRSLFADRQGTLWISTRDGRLVRFRDGTFTAFFPPRRDDLRQAARSMADDQDETLWITLDDYTVLRFKEGKFENASAHWPGGPMFNLRAGFIGAVWITGDDVSLLENATPKVVFRGDSGHYLFHAPSRTGAWWISMEGRMGLWRDGAWLWQGAAGSWNPHAPFQWGEEDNQNRLWLATFGDGVFAFDTNGVVLHFTARDGLASDYNRYVLADSEDNVWVATENGLSRIQPVLFHGYGRRQGLTADRVTGVCPAPAGGLWVGTDGGGLHRLTEGNLRDITNGPGFPLITGVLVDSATNVWAATHGGGLYRSTFGGFKRVNAAPLEDEISALFEDSAQRLWVGQRSLNTVVCFAARGGERTFTLPNPEPVADVRCFAEDESGGIWAGTAGQGLFRWGGQRCVRFGRANGLPSELIWTLYFDREDHALWVGTAGGGLARWKDRRFMVCDAARGLWDNTICQMFDDRQGWFWFGSHRGVFRVSKNSLRRFMDGELPRIHSTAYGESDGLPTLVCSGGFQPSGCRSADGKLWFPTMSGLASIDPTTVVTNPHPPVVRIERVVVNGEEVRGVNLQSPGETAAPAFQIRPGGHRCEFQYTGLSFTAPEAVEFKCRLEGLDPAWVATGTTRSATYSRLPPGDYRFVVAAANRDGIWSEGATALRFRVLPALWQTGWFRFGCLATGTVGLVATGWLAARRRARRRLAELAQAHALERERTRIAKDIHDDLGTGLTHIAWLSELAVVDSVLPAKVQDHTRRIAVQARHLVESLDETVWAVSPENDSLESLVRYIGNYAHECLEAAGLGCHIDMPDRLPPTPLAAEVRHDLFLAIKEALHNLLKHAAARNVRIRFAVEADSLVIQVEDDGHGFSADETPRPRSGHGLENMRYRLARHGGEFACASTPGKGTQLMLRLPLRQEMQTATDRERR
jgi:signal transduction histidine kinase/ligand-binding sensor domain-containing protein